MSCVGMLFDLHVLLADGHVHPYFRGTLEIFSGRLQDECGSILHTSLGSTQDHEKHADCIPVQYSGVGLSDFDWDGVFGAIHKGRLLSFQFFTPSNYVVPFSSTLLVLLSQFPFD